MGREAFDSDMGALVTFPIDRTRPPAPKVHLRIVSVDGVPMERPATRGDCKDGPRPCPWVGCRHHLYLDVLPATGNLSFTFGAASEPDELEHSCSLDVADEGGLTLDDCGKALNVTHERIRQIGDKVIERVRRHKADTLAEFIDEDPEKLDRSNPMGQGGRLGESGRITQQLADQVTDEAPEDVYVSSAVWPADPRDLREEHDAAASARIWSAYIRDSHSRGISPDEFSTKRKEQQMNLTTDDESRAKVIAAVKGGAHDRKAIAEAAGIDVGRASYFLQVLVREGSIEATGKTNGRRFYVPGQDSRDIGTVAAKPRPKSVPSPKPKKKASGHVAAATVTASHGGEDAAKSALLVMRAKAQAKVDAIDEVLASLGAS